MQKIDTDLLIEYSEDYYDEYVVDEALSFEVVGDPQKDLIAEIEVSCDKGSFSWFDPEMWVSSGYPWDTEAPEITAGSIKLEF